MTKRMLIDDTHPEETRVVVVNGNKVEDVEFESSNRKQIKGNIYLAKVMRIEPSLQAAFVDYGGNKHGFLAFGEIHPDYYNISDEEMAEVDKEVDAIIEAKKQALKEREEQRERQRIERAERRAQYEAKKAQEEAEKAAALAAAEAQKSAESQEEIAKQPEEVCTSQESVPTQSVAEDVSETAPVAMESVTEENAQPVVEDAHAAEERAIEEEAASDTKPRKRRILKKRYKKKLAEEQEKAELKVLSEATGTEEESVSEEVSENNDNEENLKQEKSSSYVNDDDAVDDDDEDEEYDFELQRKLIKVRKLYHRSNIQDVIKEGQILVVQVVKEERGNKGAAMTTYLSLAGRYCVLMPNRIKSGGVSRKITNAADRKRLKAIVKELPLTSDMSMIVRTAGEDKTKADIVRDYNYLIRSWNQIRLDALKNTAPALIHEEGNLIKRALRDMYTKDISEIIVDGDKAYQMARDFVKILSPHNLKKIKSCKKNDIPLFQRFQVESQLDKLHDCNVQLESGGYLVINPTEALVSIDVNSGRATKEKDLEETALKTNLEAADEIAKQLRMRNLAGLIVVDFIDMEDPQNNHAVEKRMKEAMKQDRARVQIAKMSCFGLLEISRQRMHSSFMESNYQVCPHCHGMGVVRTTESGAVLILRVIEEEGIKNRSAKISITVPTDIAIYLLNQKRQTLCSLEQRYNMEIVVCADDSIKNVSEYKLERIKSLKEAAKEADEEKKSASDVAEEKVTDENSVNEAKSEENNRKQRGRRNNRRQQQQVENANETTEEKVSDVSASEENEAQETEKTSDDMAENNEYNKERRNFRRDRRRDRRGRDRRRDRRNRDNRQNGASSQENEHHKEKAETIILYNSHEDIKPQGAEAQDEAAKQEKTNWWRKLIG